jgi:hypothetical protein
MAAAINCDLVVPNSVSDRERYFASARQTQILQNSAVEIEIHQNE